MSTSKRDSETNVEAERGQWSYKIDYMLSVIGFCVGLGNLWRFPYVCMQNGGGAFLIPFLICLTLCGLPILFLETSIGQFTGKGTTHLWEVCPLFRGLGWAMIITLNTFRIYYNIIIAWILYYLGYSFVSPLPWTTCDNEWNSPNCVEDSGSFLKGALNGSRINETFVYKNELFNNITSVSGVHNVNINASDREQSFTALEEFWRRKTLDMSEGIEHFGHMNVYILLCLAGSWLLVCLCIIKGIKSVGKVVYVTAVLPYILLTVILVRGLTLDGSADGLIYYLKPDFSKILDFQVWLTAVIQIFYSLGVSTGAMIAMASFNKFNNNCLRDAIILTFVCEGTSIYAGLVIFAILGYLSNQLMIPIETIVKSGPGLGFVAYPEALSKMPGQHIWSVLFFIMLLSTGLDSAFAGVEGLIVAITDTWPVLRRYRILVSILFCIFQFLCGIIFCTQAGIYVFQLVDWYAAFVLSLFGLIECIIFGWIYGAERFSRDLKLMIGRDIPVLLRICICFITPTCLAVMFIGGIIRYKPPKHGDYIYPGFATVIGFFIALAPTIPIPICAINAIRAAPGHSLKQRFLNSLKPTALWRPSDEDYQLLYDNKNCYEGTTVVERLKLNVLGD